jgi:hypothetical protein
MGCVEGAGPSTSTGSQATIAPSRGGSDREVEAPEVFQATDSALWDGRPSLGGIWVASPDVVDPERVVILNPATGKSVNGALFRRERENPGPPLQVSSDAAEALGMLAGQPTKISVTALRRLTDQPPAAAPATPAVDAVASAAAAPDAAQAAASDTAAETAALATAALAATGTSAASDATAVAAEGAVEAVATEAPKPKTWKERRAEAKARRDAERAAKAAAAEAAEAGTEGLDAAAAETVATVESAAVAVVESAPLDARAPEVAAAAEAATESAAGTEATPAPEPEVKKTRRQIREEKEAAEAAAAAAAATAEATVPAAATARPIQIASFAKEENANRAVEALAKVGVTAQAQRSEQSGKTVWGVVAAGDETLLTKIKDAGFADAFFLN